MIYLWTHEPHLAAMSTLQEYGISPLRLSGKPIINTSMSPWLTQIALVRKEVTILIAQAILKFRNGSTPH